MFVDIVKIYIKAGNGGNGAVSFHREKYVAAGGPDGGNGGKGSDIVFVADDNLSTLIDFRYKKKYIAPDGEKGGACRRTGKSAEPTVIRVPRGTLIKDTETGRILADISGDEPVVVAKGGMGGKGNMNFATSTRQIPKFAKPGYPGEEYNVTLELKLLADVGLVGFPNVGKSTFISVVSAAKPKIANYHFTTITPVLGVVTVGDRSFVMADIPGLIEVERCRMIVHVVDVSGSEGKDPKEDFEKINYELKNFSEEIAERPQIVVMNKTDLASEEQISDFKAYIEDKGLPCFACCAASAEGTPEPLTAKELDEQQLKKKSFTITKEDGIYIVDAPFLAPILQTVNMDDYESLQYFQRVLRFSGIIDKLEEMGIQENDTVSIYDFEFDYMR